MLQFDPAALTALVQVILIDVMLSGDNAMVIGLAVAGLPEAERGRTILLGVLAAAVLRFALTLVAVPLLEIVGLMLAGGILLLWVAWKMWRELRGTHRLQAMAPGSVKPKTPLTAFIQIALADISMSLDNVLGVAGAAREHRAVLLFGLGLSVVLMTVAANLVANLLQRRRWLAYVGLAVVAMVALQLIWDGSQQVWLATQRGA